MKVDLVMVVDAVAATGIDQLAAAAVAREVADIFDEEKGALGDFLFEDQGRLVGELRIRQRREIASIIVEIVIRRGCRVPTLQAAKSSEHIPVRSGALVLDQSEVLSFHRSSDLRQPLAS